MYNAGLDELFFEMESWSLVEKVFGAVMMLAAVALGIGVHALLSSL